ncbi:hypothetical protein [Calderihabitans maritimus]|uniref:Uncharacterized protein n=1 Tax=Calderihabitans maritimus TaxID=1246530 RepID=A0A1Z5HXP1_9FIRM|nr:hypothetical protein [Calderihabitans maritimus]GAW94292.1 hypothetical protein KKC1_34010 [Calderihabitans maritimus]
MNAYKKEVYSTIILTILFILAGHTGLIFVLFAPHGLKATFMGFPVHYIVPILTGWIGVVILTLVAGYVGNQLDEEIAKDREVDVKETTSVSRTYSRTTA